MEASRTHWWSKNTVAVVTGASSGIGLEITRQLAQKGLTVVLTARNREKGQAALETLKAEGLDSVVFHPLEVVDQKSVEELAIFLWKEFGGVDILINNAGILGGDYNYENAKSVINTNFYAPVKIIAALLPMFRPLTSSGRIVNVTSRLGLYERLGGESLKEQFRSEEKYTVKSVEILANKYLEDVKAGRHFEEGWIPEDKTPMYSESKIFLNMYSAALAKEMERLIPVNHPVFVTSFCPGVTETAMLEQAKAKGFVRPESHPLKTIAEGADTGIWLALLPKAELEDKNGKLFGERKEYPFGLVAPY